MILIVDDDRDLRQLLDRELTAAGHRVAQAGSGGEAIERARVHRPSVVLLDLNLPDMDGAVVMRELRAAPETARAAVMLLSGRCSERDRIAGLELGADDYIGKPFSVRELLLRIAAVERRVHVGEAETVRRAGRIEIDPAGFLVRVDGVPLPLTVTEFRLLEALSERIGRVCTRAELEQRTGSGRQAPGSRVLQVHVRRLRRKLGAAGAQIETVRAVGYRLRAV